MKTVSKKGPSTAISVLTVRRDHAPFDDLDNHVADYDNGRR
jgi:hypothetical protein